MKIKPWKWTDLFSSVEIFQTVDVDVTEQDQSFDVVRVVVDELLEEGHRL